jgi:HlyD family secretion protein
MKNKISCSVFFLWLVIESDGGKKKGRKQYKQEDYDMNDERIHPEDVDKELELLMNTAGEKPKKKKAGKKRRRILIGAAVLLVLGFAAMNALGGKAQPSIVPTVNPVKKDIKNKLSISGPVSGTDSVDVVSNLHAEVLEIPVKEGDRVEEDQVLAILDESNIKKEVEIAKNDYDLAVTTYNEKMKEARQGYEKAVQDYQTAKANYDRTKVLFDGGSMSQVELESAANSMNDARRTMESYTLVNGQPAADDSYRLQIEKARFDYEKKLEELDDAKIKSPIAGTVVRVNTKVGRFADKMENEEPLFVIENLDVLELEIKVSEYSIGKVAVGQTAEISADILNGETVQGEVISISPTGEEKGGGSSERVIPTKIRILEDNTRLIAGITAKAQIILEEAKDALSVPVSAILSVGEETYVQAVNGGMIHWIPITVGVEGDVECEIIPAEGEVLDETTLIVSAPNAAYTEGMAVMTAGGQ